MAWIREEIKQLYIKKTRLNLLLYKAHLTLLKEIHPALLPSVLQYINQQIMKFTLPTVHKHDKKLSTLTERQHNHKFAGCKHTFYNRVSNLTDIKFDSHEMNMLNKGFKYNLPDLNRNHLIKELILTEAAIKSVPDLQTQNDLRVTINSKVDRHIRTHNNNIKPLSDKLKKKYISEIKTVKQIKNKLNEHKAIAIKSDKGNTTVILPKDTHQQKVYDFIHSNNIRSIDSDPTMKYVKCINQAINKCTHLFDETTCRRLKPITAHAPQFNGLPKIHKPGIPIRPLVNYTTAPGYKVSKKLVQLIKNNITPVSYTHLDVYKRQRL